VDQTLTFDVADLYADGDVLADLLTGTSFTVSGRALTVTVAALDGLVLVPPEPADSGDDTETPDDSDPAGDSDSAAPEDTGDPAEETGLDDTGEGKVTYPLGCSCDGGATGGAPPDLAWFSLLFALIVTRRRATSSASGPPSAHLHLSHGHTP
jgi:MYXO-CTERM domain-containing protein